MRYRERLTAALIVVDAIRLPEAGEDVPFSFFEWCEAVGFEDWCSGLDETIDIFEGPTDDDIAFVAKPGDWIIKGTDGKFRPLSHDDFIRAFEEVSNAEGQGA